MSVLFPGNFNVTFLTYVVACPFWENPSASSFGVFSLLNQNTGELPEPLLSSGPILNRLKNADVSTLAQSIKKDLASNDPDAKEAAVNFTRAVTTILFGDIHFTKFLANFTEQAEQHDIFELIFCIAAEIGNPINIGTATCQCANRYPSYQGQCLFTSIVEYGNKIIDIGLITEQVNRQRILRTWLLFTSIKSVSVCPFAVYLIHAYFSMSPSFVSSLSFEYID